VPSSRANVGMRLAGIPIKPRRAQIRNLFILLPLFRVTRLTSINVSGESTIPMGPPGIPPRTASSFPLFVCARGFLLIIESVVELDTRLGVFNRNHRCLLYFNNLRPPPEPLLPPRQAGRPRAHRLAFGELSGVEPSLVSAEGATGKFNNAISDTIAINPIHKEARHPKGVTIDIRIIFFMFLAILLFDYTYLFYFNAADTLQSTPIATTPSQHQPGARW